MVEVKGAVYQPESDEEAAFLQSYDPSKFPITVVTVDSVILWRPTEDKDWRVLLIQRGGWPYKGSWALPGGFMDVHESAAEAARRELLEETGLQVNVPVLWPLEARSAPGRDPRGRCVSLPYVGFVTLPQDLVVKAGDDAAKAQWFKLKDALKLSLAFDHELILYDAVALADLESGIKRNAQTMKRVK